MKTASVRILRQDFARVLSWIESGEDVTITMRRQVVARLTPWPRKKSAKKPLPDLSARLKKVFGKKVIPDKTIQSIMDQNKASW